MNSLLKANRQILAILKERLTQLEKKEAAPVDTEKTPSKGQAYFYRSEALLEVDYGISGRNFAARSLIKTSQDSSFVVTDLYMVGVFVTENFREGNSTAFFSFNAETFIKLVNASNGRDLTVVSGDNMFPGANTDNPSFGIPFGAFTPLYSTRFGGGFAPFALDYSYKLPVEYQLPRGAVIEAMAQWTPGIPYYGVGVDFVLGGYKVFGA